MDIIFVAIAVCVICSMLGGGGSNEKKVEINNLDNKIDHDLDKSTNKNDQY